MTSNSSSSTPVSFTVPDIGNLTDEEMRSLVRLQDGRWSSRTQSLMNRFGAGKLDLNRHWAATWQGWSCPCCKRTKTQIARMTSSEVLMCRLEVHHDHLGDLAKTIYREVISDGLHENERIKRSRAEDFLIPLAERFERVIICVDCNLAEARAKEALRGEVDQHFTFTPSEIACFIEVGDNRPHAVDVDAARDGWNAVRSDFYDRIEFARLMADRVRAGRNLREPAMGGPFRPTDVIRRLVDETSPVVARRNLAHEIMKRSVSRAGTGSSSKARPKKAVRPPTDAEFSAVDAHMTPISKTWRKAGDDWSCPACGRSKREILRKSNRGLWTAKIQRVWDYELEERRDALARRSLAGASSPIIGGFRPVLLCQDCRNITAQMAQRDLSFEMEAITLEDIRELGANAVPHVSHEIDFEIVQDMASENQSLLTGIKQFKAHRDTARSLTVEIINLKASGYTESGARNAVSSKFVAELFPEDPDEAEYYLEWMLEEDDRLEVLEKAEF